MQKTETLLIEKPHACDLLSTFSTSLPFITKFIFQGEIHDDEEIGQYIALLVDTPFFAGMVGAYYVLGWPQAIPARRGVVKRCLETVYAEDYFFFKISLCTTKNI